MAIGPAQVGLIIVGVLLLCVGGWALFFDRSKRREVERLHIAGESTDPPTPSPKLTEPTRLSIAICSLVLGYHLIVWAFPPGAVGVQLSRAWWWVWVLVGILVVGLSFVMDRLDERPSPPTPRPPPSDPSG